MKSLRRRYRKIARSDDGPAAVGKKREKEDPAGQEDISRPRRTTCWSRR